MSRAVAGFYDAHRAWAKHLRTVGTLSWQQGRVAWALGEFFSSQHGIAYPSFDTIGETAGGIDRREVARVIAALLALSLIHEVKHSEIAAAASRDGVAKIGGRLRGFRMILREGTPAAEAGAMVAFAPMQITSPRIRRKRNKGGTVPPLDEERCGGSKGGTQPPIEEVCYRGQIDHLSGAKALPMGGTWSPQIVGTGLIEEDARPARASSTSDLVDISEHQSKPATGDVYRAPKGAVLSRDHKELAAQCFGELSQDHLSALSDLAERIGIQKFTVHLVNLGHRQLTEPSAVSARDWVEGLARSSRASRGAGV
ncbi:hypothetical protein ABIB57_000071 [Devosia sp. UYZn731]